MSERITLALTGASGVQYGLRLLECLVKADCQIFMMVSRAARVVVATETDITLEGDAARMEDFLTNLYQATPEQIKVFELDQWMAPVASGSGSAGKMVICPCSMGTLSAVACGASNNLIERAADVALKERHKLIVVPRESPYSEIHLENMLKLTRMGAVMVPASPGFYNKPVSVEDMVDFVVARILSQLDIKQGLMPGWGDSYC